MRRTIILLFAATGLAACASVHPEDLASWDGRPVSDLDLHPVFATMKVVRTLTADGTEVRNYVNSRDVVSCSGDGTIYRGFVNQVNYDQFMSCTHNTPTCNNIFYIKGGVVQRYTPIGTGGGKCFTDQRVRPDFRGPTNL